MEFRYDLDLLEKLASVQRVAAVIITPEVNFFPAEYHRRLQTLVHQHGALLILDEVMTGFRYALGGYHTAVGLTPDLITLSKGLANGMALSAVAGRADVLNATEKTYLGNTYQREVTPFAAALSTLDALRDGTALARMRQVGEQLINGLNEVFVGQQVEAWAFAWPTMFDVMFADAELGHAFFQEMWSRGFLMQYGGRFMPSAALSDADPRSKPPDRLCRRHWREWIAPAATRIRWPPPCGSPVITSWPPRILSDAGSLRPATHEHQLSNRGHRYARGRPISHFAGSARRRQQVRHDLAERRAGLASRSGDRAGNRLPGAAEPRSAHPARD
ncbi:aminotransferase class III-fold pyridoxal phosphate-dependent enzyme [Bradyrhizobium sp. sBnM-33]|uniref:aminotransferase class III-fold pyridoxal phosphate-dependent enzyme n=1 Tax=Bradyrhizobium sp. sBnM-33 TaxID=2831780 RepID=UPI00289B4D2E|nr:aminotransferase class III-fold pyridoxal phosphate-dependent enzyme [Bradyrhizobium sp. sBnM-33]WOH52931.1 aminotransferase class III-fold pyridoxal phosphate-dependent enzyme [Bradyrhizobium sp. sBnM-33]